MYGLTGPQKNGLLLYVHLSICDGWHTVDLPLACHINCWMCGYTRRLNL